MLAHLYFDASINALSLQPHQRFIREVATAIQPLKPLPSCAQSAEASQLWEEDEAASPSLALAAARFSSAPLT